MIADLGHVDGEAAVGGWHEFAAVGQEVYYLLGVESLYRTGVEGLCRAEALDDGLYEALFILVSVALHHVEDFVSVCHNL